MSWLDHVCILPVVQGQPSGNHCLSPGRQKSGGEGGCTGVLHPTPHRVFVFSSFSATSHENSSMCLLIRKVKHDNGVQSRCRPCFYPPLLSLHAINGLLPYCVFDNMLIFLNSRSWGTFHVNS